MSVYHLWEPYPRIQGVNILQDRHIAFDNQSTRLSFEKLKKMGANSVAFVPFIDQENDNSLTLNISESVTREQLLAGIQFAQQVGLRIILKPQILIDDSWAGAVNHNSDSKWLKWFEAYENIIIDYAVLAQKEQVDILVIGTELNQAEKRPEWISLIANVRLLYSGEISYCAQNIEGLKNFAHWQLLDSASLSLYPSLGESGKPAEIINIIDNQSKELRNFTEQHDTPLWIAEIGMASRQGAFQEPWEWQSKESQEGLVDELLQAQVLHFWLEALEGGWNRGVLVWAWYNAPNAGGSIDNGFSPQNKMAENILACHWQGPCPHPQLLESI